MQALIRLCLLLLCLPAMLCAAPRTTIEYGGSASLAFDCTVSRAAKFHVVVDEQCPDAHRAELAAVLQSAQKAGLVCTERPEADYELVVTTDSTFPTQQADAYDLYNIRGTLFPVLDHGARLAPDPVWEGDVRGRKGTIQNWGKKNSPPYVEPAVLAERLVAMIGQEVADTSVTPVGDSLMTLAKGLPVESPPAATVSACPTVADFNAVVRRFFADDRIDLGKDPINPEFVRTLSAESPNGLYRKLKLREREYGGAINVSPMAFMGKAIIVVTVRVVHKDGRRRNMYMRALHIVFSGTGKLMRVERGLYQQQEL